MCLNSPNIVPPEAHFLYVSWALSFYQASNFINSMFAFLLQFFNFIHQSLFSEFPHPFPRLHVRARGGVICLTHFNPFSISFQWTVAFKSILKAQSTIRAIHLNTAASAFLLESSSSFRPHTEKSVICSCSFKLITYIWNKIKLLFWLWNSLFLHLKTSRLICTEQNIRPKDTKQSFWFLSKYYFFFVTCR